ncbi:hypothetical protein [Nocardia sp. CNY236]|uniref:hypothetical protein n=1 Tax=Nocardia sp. CNY236 TaxID=1169152 RepID=UPI00040951C3|nr:hypothetical protein [Nocardia sp. CNY236]
MPASPFTATFYKSIFISPGSAPVSGAGWQHVVGVAGLDYRGEEREQDAPGAGGVVDSGQRSGVHFEHDAVGGEVVGQRG